MRSNEAGTLVGSLSFVTVMSLIPLLAVGLGAFHLYGGFAPLLKKIEPIILDNLVAGSGTEIKKRIHDLIIHINGKTLGIGGVAGLLLTSTRLFFDIEKVVLKIWGEKPSRNFIKKTIVYWGLIFLGPLLFAIAIGIISTYGFGLIEVLPKSAIGFSFVFSAFYILYRYMPQQKVLPWAAVVSALGASLALGGAEKIYVWLAKKTLSYNKLYGSLATIPIFLLWISVMWWICIAGIALTRELQNEFKPKSKDLN